MKDRVWSRLNNWNNKSLSHAGKEVLLKTVAQALPTYTMDVMLLPIGFVGILKKCSILFGGVAKLMKAKE